jgi:flagella basal body P-ring formation protein FlgA
MRSCFYFGIAFSVLQASVSGESRAEAPNSVVRIALKASAPVSNSIVRLGDIASISGGNDQIRNRIIDLDVADPPTLEGSDVVSQARVAIRLQLAGIPDNAFQIEGSDRVHIRLAGASLSEETILRTIQESLADHWHVAVDDLDVRLTQPLTNLPELPTDEKHVEIQPYLPEYVQAGPLRVRVAVNAAGRPASILSVSLDARLFQTVARVQKTIHRGDAFTDENVEFVRVPLAGHALKSVVKEVRGKVARQSLPIGEIVKATHVGSPLAVQADYVIQPRSAVRLVARKGGLTVTVLDAESLQRGRIGDLIRVRNMRSKVILTGVVVSPTEVEVSL